MNRFIAIICLLTVAILTMATKTTAAENTTGETPPVSGRFLVATDRNLQRRLEQLDTLIQRQRYTETVQLIGMLLESPTNSFLPKDDEPQNPTSQTTVKSYLESVFRSLPDEAKNLYSLQNDPKSKRLFDTAVTESDTAALAEIVQNYFYTPSGRDATFVLAMIQFDRGNIATTLRLLRRLQTECDTTDIARYEPVLSLTLATCELRMGLSAAARKTLENFWRHHSSPTLSLPTTSTTGTGIWTPKNVDEMLEYIGRREPAPQVATWLEHTGWLLPGGTPWQFAVMNASIPLLDLTWESATIRDSRQLHFAKLAQRQIQSGNQSYLPAASPLQVGDFLLYRTKEGVTALNRTTGKRVWVCSDLEVNIPPRATGVLYFQTDRQNREIIHNGMQSVLVAMARIQFWHDRLTASLSSDGVFVYSLEGTQPNSIYPGQRKQVVLIQQSGEAGTQIEDPRDKNGNTLVARRVTDGEVVWCTGKHSLAQKEVELLVTQYVDKTPPSPSDVVSDDERFLGETFFLGAPLPYENQLYILGENGGVISLFVLDRLTGRRLRHFPLMQPSTDVEQNGLRRLAGQMPAASQGIVVCPTGAGVLAGMDVQTMTPLWCLTYSKPEDTQPSTNGPDGILVPAGPAGLRAAGGAGGGGGNVIRKRPFNLLELASSPSPNDMMEKQYLATWGWQLPCVMVVGHRVVFAPADEPFLYGVNLLDGTILWERPRAAGMYVACVHDDTIVVVENNGVTLVSLTDGTTIIPQTESKWPPVEKNGHSGGVPFQSSFPATIPDGVRPAGTGVYTGEEYLFPLTNGQIVVFHLQRHTLTLSSQSFQSGKLGNLVAIRGQIFSQSPLAVNGFHQVEPLRIWAEHQLQQNPDDTAAMVELAKIHRAAKNYDAAIALWKRALPLLSHSQLAAVRELLLDGLARDYSQWQGDTDILLTLAETPEDTARLWTQLAVGAKKQTDWSMYFRAISMLVTLNTTHDIMVPLDDISAVRLRRWIGAQVRQLTAAQISTLSAAQETELRPYLNQFSAATNTKTASPNTISSSTAELNVGEKDGEKYREKDTTPDNWPGGMYRFSKLSPATAANPFSSSPSSSSSSRTPQRLTDLQRLTGMTSVHILQSRQFLPLLGEPNPLLSQKTFYLDTHDKPELGCLDEFGRLLWRWPIPQNSAGQGQSGFVPPIYGGGGYYSSETSIFLKSVGHVLYFSFGTRLFAMDTSTGTLATSPRILWEYELTEPLIATLPQSAATRLSTMSSLLTGQQVSVAATWQNRFPYGDTFFANSQIVCFHDADRLVALDPLTGEVFWVRGSTSIRTSLCGDENHLFAMSSGPVSATGQSAVAAMNMDDGSVVATCAVPAGILRTVGRTAVCVNFPSSSQTTQTTRVSQNQFVLETYDFADMLTNISTEVSDVSYSTSDMFSFRDKTLLPVLTPRSSTGNLAGETIFRFSADNTLLAVVRPTGTLSVYDSQTGTPRISAAAIPRIAGRETTASLPLRDVLIDESFGGIAVTVVEEFVFRQNNVGGIRYQYRPLQIGLSTGVNQGGVAAMMKFDRDGNPAWAAAVTLQNCLPLPHVPRGLPVYLFGAVVTEIQPNGRTSTFPAVMGIDKRTGEKVFSCKFLSDTRLGAIQGFVVTADPVQKTLIFFSPQEVFVGEITKPTSKTLWIDKLRDWDESWESVYPDGKFSDGTIPDPESPVSRQDGTVTTWNLFSYFVVSHLRHEVRRWSPQLDPNHPGSAANRLRQFDTWIQR